MRREIEEIPEAIGQLLAADPAPIVAAAELIRSAQPRFIAIVARGTSDHAAVYARYLLEVYLGIPVSLAAPSVTTIYGSRLQLSGGLLVAISQSGEGGDLLALCREARRQRAPTIGITNDGESALASEVDQLLLCHAGTESAVPATKTYTATLAVLAAIVARLVPASDVAVSLPRLVPVLREALRAASAWVEGPGLDAFADADRAIIVSRGFNLATALEVALKLKETTATFVEASSSADLLHGPIVLATREVPILAIRPDGPMGKLVDDAIAGARRRGATPLIIGGQEVAQGPHSLSLALGLPEALTPLPYALPGQLLAEAVARFRRLDPDRPGGLSKVTATR